MAFGPCYQGRTFAAQAAEDEVIPEEVERRFVENALRACAKMTRETQKSRNKLTLLHQEFDSKVSRPFFMPGSSVAFRDCAVATDAFLRFAQQDGEWAREHESFNDAQRVAVSSEEISVADQLD